MKDKNIPMRRTLLNDIVFKMVFGSPQNERVLRSLLNAVLELDGQDKILSLDLMPNELGRDHVNAKGAILDVRAKDGHGRRYNVEVQVRGPANYIERSLYYLARLYSEQLERGDDHSRLRRSVAISILDFVLFPGRPAVHSRFRFCDSRQGLELSDILEIHYLELTKFKRDRPLQTPLEKWLHLLRFAELYGRGLEPLPESIRAEEEMTMAFDAMNNAYADEEVLYLIDMGIKARLEASAERADAIKEGRAQGMAEGKAEGIAEGKAKGIAEGKAEGIAAGKAEAAQAMSALGLDSETIFKATGIRL